MEAIKNDELFDDELCGMVKFTDATVKHTQPDKATKKPVSKEPVKENKAAQKPTDKPMDAEYEPVKTWYDEKTVNMVKWVVVFMGLEYLFFYWQQTGQMKSTAAMPSMIVCALLAGISVGKNWKWRR
jgi:hypothetical protein